MNLFSIYHKVTLSNPLFFLYDNKSANNIMEEATVIMPDLGLSSISISSHNSMYYSAVKVESASKHLFSWSRYATWIVSSVKVSRIMTLCWCFKTKVWFKHAISCAWISVKLLMFLKHIKNKTLMLLPDWSIQCECSASCTLSSSPGLALSVISSVWL